MDRAAITVTAIVCAAGLAGPAPAQDGATGVDPAWRERLRTDARDAYQRYLAVANRLDEQIEVRTAPAAGGAAGQKMRPHTRRERFVRSGPNTLAEHVRVYDDDPQNPQIRLECDNPDYYFTLTKAREDAPYALVKYALGKRDPPLADRGGRIHGLVFDYLKDVVTAAEGGGPRTLTGVRQDPATGLVQATYTLKAGDTPVERRAFLDPAHGWRVTEVRTETPSLSNVDRISYGHSVSGQDLPAEVHTLTTYKVSNGPPPMDIDARVVKVSLADTSDDAFRLSAFGLPEPADAPARPKSAPRHLWLLGAAAVCAAGSLGLGYWYRRRAQARAACARKGVLT